jgi:addiction module HigA family antidote
MQTHSFRPDYAIPPGEILEETLEVRGIKKVEFAARCGRPAKTISEIIAGKAAITPETAIQFERVLDIPARLWLNLEAKYRLRLAEQTEKEEFVKYHEWANSFPIREMVSFGLISKPANQTDAVEKLLDFLGVGSVQAWEKRFHECAIAYRRSPSFQSAPQSVAAWLRWGERQADQIECAAFNEHEFRNALKEIRLLTKERVKVFRPRMVQLCAATGVAVTLVPDLPRTRLSGAARWLTADKALIQLSLRHKSDDHLWFTFFHEAGHIILHGKKDVFIDEENTEEDEKEKQADRFATNALIPYAEWRKFTAGRRLFSKASVSAFAATQDIAPGVVVGRLQHEGLIPHSHLNGLKKWFEWTVKT